MEEKNVFVFNKKSPVILYGAATIGCMLLEHLTRSGYLVKGFMDMRAEEMKELLGKPVFLPDEESLSKDCVIILAVKNVFEHSRIADELIKRGFHQLIFRPYACLKGQGNEMENQLNEAYSALTDSNGGMVSFDGMLPLTQSPYNQLKMSGIIVKEGEMITACIPVTMLFSDKKPYVPEFSILFMKPHLQFAKYVLGIAGGETEPLLQYCREGAAKVGGFKTTALWESNVIRNQAEVYAQMNHMYNVEKSFFLEQAPLVKWNEKKYFNLQSGKHRSTFLAAKGDNYIAVKMTRNDFEAWVQEAAVPEIKEALEKQYKHYPAVPVENPYFYEASCIEEQFWYQLARTVMEEVAKTEYRNANENILSEHKFVTALSDGGFMKRFLRRCGFITAPRSEADELEQRLDRLLGFEEANTPDTIQDWHHVKYMIWEEGVLPTSSERCEAENLFLITDKKDVGGEKLLSGLCKGRQVNVYLRKDVIL